MSDRERWNVRWQDAEALARPPATFVCTLAPYLPKTGRALDVAGGAGRHARWLAAQGLTVTVADVSDVGLAAARAAGLATIQVDLEREPLPPGPWDVILVNHFLYRPLLRTLPDALAPGGLLIYVHMTKRNLERHDHPAEIFLLDEHELSRTLAPFFDVLIDEEGWGKQGEAHRGPPDEGRSPQNDRHEARLVGRRT